MVLGSIAQIISGDGADGDILSLRMFERFNLVWLVLGSVTKKSGVAMAMISST